MFNKTVDYEDKQCSWSYVILLKTRELAQDLTGTKKKIDFSTPYYEIERQESEEIRKQILSISYTDWKKLGFSKGTLHYMKQNAKSNKPFTLNKHVRDRLVNWDKLTVGIWVFDHGQKRFYSWSKPFRFIDMFLPRLVLIFCRIHCQI